MIHYTLQAEFTLIFAPKLRTINSFLLSVSKQTNIPNIALAIPIPLVLSLKTPHSSTQSQQNSQPITISLHFSSNSTNFA